MLATSGKFINNFGANAILLTGSRFLIYSADPAQDVFGGLQTPNLGIFGTSYPTPIAASGNRYVFSVASSPNTNTRPFLAPAANGGLTATSSGLTAVTGVAAAPALVGFVTAPCRCRRSPPGGTDIAARRRRCRRHRHRQPRRRPPGGSPLADHGWLDGSGERTEPPSSSDQATSFVASSLEGGLPPIVSANSGPIIPQIRPAPSHAACQIIGRSQRPASCFGNIPSLWQRTLKPHRFNRELSWI